MSKLSIIFFSRQINFTLKIPDTLSVSEDVFDTNKNSLNSRQNANKALDPNIPI